VSVADRYGYLDLMLQLELPPGPHEVWFEIKTGSPEGVGQLAFYRAVIDANADDGVERHLVALAPYAISRDQHHVFVSWQEVATAARMHATSPFWHDLVEFLEEIGMTEESTLPVTAREAAAVTDAHRLFTKTKAVLTRVNAWAREHITDWPDDAWWKDGQIRGGMLRQFAEKGRFTLYDGTMFPAFLIWGAVPREGEAWFAVWVEADPRRTEVRARLLQSVEATLPDWQRPHGTWQVLAAERRATGFESEDELVSWFTARLQELQQAGVYRLAMQLGGGPVVSTAPGPSVEGEQPNLDEALGERDRSDASTALR
jgi:hypothetical protein